LGEKKWKKMFGTECHFSWDHEGKRKHKKVAKKKKRKLRKWDEKKKSVLRAPVGLTQPSPGGGKKGG